MKNVFNAFIERLRKETGYSYDFLVEKYNEAMSNGTSVIDFVDSVLDSAVLGTVM